MPSSVLQEIAKNLKFSFSAKLIPSSLVICSFKYKSILFAMKYITLHDLNSSFIRGYQ